MNWLRHELVPLALFFGLPFVVVPLLLLGGLVWTGRRLSPLAGRLLRAVAALLILALPVLVTVWIWHGADSPVGIGGAAWPALLWLPALVPLLAAIVVAGRVAGDHLAGRPAVGVVLMAGVLATALVLWPPWYRVTEAVAVCGPVDGVRDYLSRRQPDYSDTCQGSGRCSFDCAYESR